MIFVHAILAFVACAICALGVLVVASFFMRTTSDVDAQDWPEPIEHCSLKL